MWNPFKRKDVPLFRVNHRRREQQKSLLQLIKVTEELKKIKIKLIEGGSPQSTIDSADQYIARSERVITIYKELHY